MHRTDLTASLINGKIITMVQSLLSLPVAPAIRMLLKLQLKYAILYDLNRMREEVRHKNPSMTTTMEETVE
jgi:hypothetical protein